MISTTAITPEIQTTTNDTLSESTALAATTGFTITAPEKTNEVGEPLFLSGLSAQTVQHVIAILGTSATVIVVLVVACVLAIHAIYRKKVERGKKRVYTSRAGNNAGETPMRVVQNSQPRLDIEQHCQYRDGSVPTAPPYQYKFASDVWRSFAEDKNAVAMESTDLYGVGVADTGAGEGIGAFVPTGAPVGSDLNLNYMHHTAARPDSESFCVYPDELSVLFTRNDGDRPDYEGLPHPCEIPAVVPGIDDGVADVTTDPEQNEIRPDYEGLPHPCQISGGVVNGDITHGNAVGISSVPAVNEHIDSRPDYEGLRDPCPVPPALVTDNDASHGNSTATVTRMDADEQYSVEQPDYEGLRTENLPLVSDVDTGNRDAAGANVGNHDAMDAYDDMVFTQPPECEEGPHSFESGRHTKQNSFVPPVAVMNVKHIDDVL